MASGGWPASLDRALRRGRRGRPGHPSGLWAALGDPLDARPKLRSTVEARHVPVRWGDDYVVIGDADLRRHFRLEPWEWAVAQAMDGSTTVEGLVALRLEHGGLIDPSAVIDLVELLRAGGLLEGDVHDVWRSLEAALKPRPSRFRRVGRAVSSLSVEWNGAERVVRALYRTVLVPFFSRTAQPFLVCVAIVGLVSFGVLAVDGRLALRQGSVLAGAAIVALSLVMTFIHELGHAAYLVHRGRRVYSAGFMLYFGSPAFFVDATDGLLLDRRDRIRQAFAGPYYELVAGGFVAIGALFVPPGALADMLHVFVLLLYFGVFLNLIPLLELDGYWIFAELLETPTLRSQSFQFVRHELPSRLSRRLPIRPHEVGFVGYALIGTAFTVWSVWIAAEFWWALFGPMVSGLWAGGATGRLVLGVAAVAVAGPALQGLAALARALSGRLRALIGDAAFQLQTGWRVEAALLLDDSSVFADLDEETLNEIAGRVHRRRVPGGSAIFRQGDRPDAFFVVRRGTLQVVSERTGPGGRDEVIATLTRGDSFGEIGLLGHDSRTATVRAAEGDAEVFVVRESEFDRLLRDELLAPEFAPTLAQLDTLSRLPVFRHLSSSRLADLHGAGEWVDVAPGTAIVREGRPGDAFYVIVDGQAEVTQRRRPLRQLGAGDSFGELALQSGGPRTATVRAITPMRLFRIPPPAFRRFVRAEDRPRQPGEPDVRVMSH